MTVVVDLLAYLMFSEVPAIFGASWKEEKQTDRIASWYMRSHKYKKPILKAVTVLY